MKATLYCGPTESNAYTVEGADRVAVLLRIRDYYLKSFYRDHDAAGMYKVKTPAGYPKGAEHWRLPIKPGARATRKVQVMILWHEVSK